MRYRVDLNYKQYSIEVEADSKEEAIEKAAIQVTNDPNNYFTAEDEIANLLADRFYEYHDAEPIEEQTQ